MDVKMQSTPFPRPPRHACVSMSSRQQTHSVAALLTPKDTALSISGDKRDQRRIKKDTLISSLGIRLILGSLVVLVIHGQRRICSVFRAEN